MTDQELRDLIAASMARADRLDAQQARTDAQLAATDAQLAKTDAQLAKTDQKLEKLGILYGGLSENLGAAAEEFFVNSLIAHPVIGGVHYDEVHAKVYGGPIGRQQEYDIVLINRTAAAIVEVKHKIHPSAIEQVRKQLELYRDHFPDYQRFTLYGGIAGMSIPDEVVAAAQEQGLFVLKQQGTVMEVASDNMQAF